MADEPMNQTFTIWQHSQDSFYFLRVRLLFPKSGKEVITTIKARKVR